MFKSFFTRNCFDFFCHQKRLQMAHVASVKIAALSLWFLSRKMFCVLHLALPQGSCVTAPKSSSCPHVNASLGKTLSPTRPAPHVCASWAFKLPPIAPCVRKGQSDPQCKNSLRGQKTGGEKQECNPFTSQTGAAGQREILQAFCCISCYLRIAVRSHCADYICTCSAGSE